MDETKILLECWSPICNVQAFVEENEKTVYFYLWFYPGTDYAQMRSCWVCNTVSSTDETDFESMNNGTAPLMPISHVAHAHSGIHLDSDSLSVVWFEEGDAAALFEKDKLIAVIPGWSGEDFHGYSIYAKEMGPFAWELKSALHVFSHRISKSKAYWEIMSNDYFGKLQENEIAAVESFFGPHKQYFAIDGGEFPPRALITGEKNKIQYAFTIGNGALVQPAVEQYIQEDTLLYRRFEMGIAFSPIFDAQYIKPMLSYVAAQVSLPWLEINWLGHGHTIPCNTIPGYSAVMIIRADSCHDYTGPRFPDFAGEPINLFWLHLLTPDEYKLAQENSEKVIENKGLDISQVNGL